MNLIDWIDKNMNNINSHLFNQFFLGKKIEKDDDTLFIESLENGIDIILSEKLIVEVIHLYSEGYNDACQFDGNIPNGISFSMSRNDVQTLLGPPRKIGGGENNLYFGKVPIWDKYFFDNYSQHIQYNDTEEKIALITLSSLNLEEYFNIGLQ